MVDKMIPRRISAFSLAESIVAMVVLLTIFAITVQQTAVIMLSARGPGRLQAAAVLDSFVTQTRKRGEINDGNALSDKWAFSVRTAAVTEAPALLQLTFSLYKRHDLQTPYMQRILLIDPSVYAAAETYE